MLQSAIHWYTADICLKLINKFPVSSCAVPTDTATANTVAFSSTFTIYLHWQFVSAHRTVLGNSGFEFCASETSLLGPKINSVLLDLSLTQFEQCQNVCRLC